MRILIAEDSPTQQMLLAAILEEAGYKDLALAATGEEALAHLAQPWSLIDLILTDLHMPGLNGIEVCRQVKKIPGYEDVPIILITTSDKAQDLQQAFAAGAVDYITKPPGEVELLARVRSALKLKEEMDSRKEQQQRLRQMLAELSKIHFSLVTEEQKSERLLLNVLPRKIADQLKSQPESSIIANYFKEATVLFVDLVGFSAFSAHLSAGELVALLNEFFSLCDRLVETYGLEKIKTIGDAYMAVAGVPDPRPDHAEAAADMALALRAEVSQIAGGKLTVRVGLHSGPVVAGVIGSKKFSYDLWGDTVNLASRMEASGIAGEIQTTAATFGRLRERYSFEERTGVSVKGLGSMSTYLLQRKVSSG